MSIRYAKQPVSIDEPISDDQVQNEAGGYVWTTSAMQQVLRFLILGVTGNTYYIRERDLFKTNLDALKIAIKTDWAQVLGLVVDVSNKGRAASNDPALYVLALLASDERQHVRSSALANLDRVARIPTHLFHFAQYVDDMRGWGPQLRRAISNWYNRDIETVAFQTLKYQSRDGWSNRDLLRLSHARPSTDEHNLLFRWIVRGLDKTTERYPVSAAALAAEVQPGDWWRRVMAVDTMHKATPDVELVLDLVEKHRLTREMVPTQYLKNKDLQRVMFKNLGLTAVIRNLGNYGELWQEVGMLEELRSRLTKENVAKARLHPLQVFVAERQYGQGHGMRGKNTWPVSGPVLAMLNDAFYMAFDNIEPTNKSILLGLDHSGSMSGGLCNDIPGLTPAVGAGLMGMATVYSEPYCHVVGFGSSVREIPLHKRMSLEEVRRHVGGRGEATDCSLPIKYAMNKNMKVDAIVLYTDSQDWWGGRGRLHVAEQMNVYRSKFNKDAKLMVCAMVGNEMTLLDPKDPNSLGVVGFDTNTPRLISEFVLGNV